MSGGCTIGAKRLPGRLYLFKNRDLVYDDFKDRAIFNDRMFSVSGVDIAEGVERGISIGVNSSGFAVCSSSVLINDGAAYDILLEEILREANTISEAEDIVRKALDAGEEYQWCNFILGSIDEVGAIELSSDEYNLERDDIYVVRANHHLKLPTATILSTASIEEREACGPLPTSQERRQVASKMVEQATAFQDFISIVSSHSASRGFDSICRHKDALVSSGAYLGETSYSYIVEMLQLDEGFPDITFHVARGNPCSHPFKQVPLSFEVSEEARVKTIEDFP
ncbi:MAG: hypothetical protein ACW98Y_03785 [Candidatus Thorarchaeota archaeon]|jgi:hypothetical protein